MKKEILVSVNKLEEYVDASIVADDVNAYELILNTKDDLTDCTLEIVATRSDGAVITDLGKTDGNCAKYLLKNSMYAVPGNLILRLRILNEEQSALTTKILNLNVIEGSGSEDGVTATNEYPVLTKLIIDTKEICERTEAIAEDAEEILENIPVVLKNENTIVTKDGDNFVGKDCNDGFVAGKENKYNDGKYSVIFGHNNDVTGHSNIVSGSKNVVKGLHNLVVGNKLNVTDDGTAQVIFGLGEDVPIPKNVAIAYYQTGKPAFLVTKDGDLTLNGNTIASIPSCDTFDDTYVLESETTNLEYPMNKVKVIGADEHTHRLVVNNMPEVSEDWIGYTIEFIRINEDGTIITESTRIRNIERAGSEQPVISIDEGISYLESGSNPTDYWHKFTIKGAKYVWNTTALIPPCESNITENYIPVCINVSDTHYMNSLFIIGSNTTQYRLGINKSLIPNLSKDWIGYTIEFTSKENETERTIIRDIEDNNGLNWIIVIDKSISHMNSESEAKEYWATFTIKNNKYIWDSKPTVDQTFDAKSENAQSGKAVAELVDAINKGIEELTENVNKGIEDVANKVEDIVLSDIERAYIPVCENDGNFVLECDAVNRSYGDIIDCTGETTTNGYHCGRIEVIESGIPDISSVDWVGKEITLRNTNTSGKEIIYISIIRDVVQRTDNPNHWNIDFDYKKGWYSGSSWNGGFTIKGANYTWKSKTDLFEEIKKYIQG